MSKKHTLTADDIVKVLNNEKKQIRGKINGTNKTIIITKR